MSKTITTAYPIIIGYPIQSFNNIAVNTSLPSDSRNYYNYRDRSVKYIVLHYTGNSKDTAKANASYFNSGSRGASAHYFVDDANCYQSVALNNAAWAVGGTKTYKHSDCRNLNSVSIEMCCSGGYMVSERTEINAAYLCAELCRYIGITADEVDKYVLRHWDVWAKSCPAKWTGDSNSRWDGFKNKVKMILNNESEDLTMSQYDELKAKNMSQDEIINAMIKEIAEMKTKIAERTGYFNYIDNNMNPFYRPTIQKLVGKGVLQGNERGELMLTDDMMRILTILDRVGIFG